MDEQSNPMERRRISDMGTFFSVIAYCTSFLNLRLKIALADVKNPKGCTTNLFPSCKNRESGPFYFQQIDVVRYLVVQRVRLVAHHHPHPEVAQLRILRDRACPRKRLRQPPHHQAQGALRKRQIVRRHRTAARLLHVLRPEYEKVLDLRYAAVDQRPQPRVARRLEFAEPRNLPPSRV